MTLENMRLMLEKAPISGSTRELFERILSDDYPPFNWGRFYSNYENGELSLREEDIIEAEGIIAGYQFWLMENR